MLVGAVLISALWTQKAEPIAKAMIVVKNQADDLWAAGVTARAANRSSLDIEVVEKGLRRQCADMHSLMRDIRSQEIEDHSPHYTGAIYATPDEADDANEAYNATMEPSVQTVDDYVVSIRDAVLNIER